MLFMVIERFKQGDSKPVGERFRRSGRMLPVGLVYHASWMESAGGRCFQVMEASHPDLLKSWMSCWDDLIDFEIIPIETSSDFWAKKSGVETSYDQVADEYVQRIYDELRHKPLDRQLLGRFAARVMTVGLACDMGCGPGHVARYLRERGAHVCGIDISTALVERARRLNPGIDFRQGDMLALPAADGTWAGIAAFYSIIHIPRGDVVRALRELRRVLRPGGLLLLAFHIGDGTVHLDEWWGHKVCIDFFSFRSDEMAGYVRSAAFEIEEIIERDPYPDVEHQSRRAYIFAQKPLAET
jgi:SAM-dependent methyltransferase